MSYSAGVYTLPTGNPPTTATAITVSWATTTFNDLATALSTCVLKDGTQTATAQVPFAQGLTAGGGAFAVDASGNLAVTTNKFTVAASTGNTSIAGTATVASSIIPSLSTGSAIFAMDGNLTGISIANNGTATPFSNSNIFSGMFLVSDTVAGSAAIFLTGNGVISIVAQTSTDYSTASGTGSKINIYLTANAVTIENKLGSTTEVRVMAFRTRNRE